MKDIKKSKIEIQVRVGGGWRSSGEVLASSHPPIEVRLGGEMTVQSARARWTHAEKDTA